jgi:hypothetical protein
VKLRPATANSAASNSRTWHGQAIKDYV